MATVRWISGANPVTQRTRFTLGGTWLATETATLTCNGQDITVTLADQVAVADVVDILVRAVNASSKTDDLRLNESRNIGGQEIPEFREIRAWSGGVEFDANTLVLEAKVPGKPFTVTASETSTSGTISAGTDDPAATGPHHFDNGDNWSGGSVPSTNDTVLFDGGSQSCLYGLDSYQGGTEIEVAALRIHQSFVGHIGLPRMNVDDPGHPYSEYRTQYLTFKEDSAAGVIEIGTGIGAGSGRIKIDTANSTAFFRVYGSGSRIEPGVPAILLKTTSAPSDAYIYDGDVGIGYFDDESVDIDNLRIGRLNSTASPSVYFGRGGTTTTLMVFSGFLELKAGSTTLTQYGGEIVVRENASYQIATANIYRGRFDCRSSQTIATLNIGRGAVVDFGSAIESIIVTNCSLGKAGTLTAPHNLVTFSNGVALQQCDLNDVTVDFGEHVTLALS